MSKNAFPSLFQRGKQESHDGPGESLTGKLSHQQNLGQQCDL